MTFYKPATAHSNSICATSLHQVRNSDVVVHGIEAADRPGYELLTFECPRLQTY